MNSVGCFPYGDLNCFIAWLIYSWNAAGQDFSAGYFSFCVRYRRSNYVFVYVCEYKKTSREAFVN